MVVDRDFWGDLLSRRNYYAGMLPDEGSGVLQMRRSQDVPGFGFCQRGIRILVVEDEPKVANALREGLEGERCSVAVEHSGDAAETRLETETFDVILLDLNLPDRDGIEMLGTLRQRGVETPVLILSARDSLRDRVIGLECGADDYVIKPFAFEEVLARIRALLRRGRENERTTLEVGDLHMNITVREVKRAGRTIDLTLREFELLEYLLRNRDHVVSRGTLARELWAETVRATPLDNVIDVHVARLRKKIDLDHAVKLIHTVRGVGFILRESGP
jgi:two-component system copper resistance phosphate regulon response regulator CusR